MKDQYKHYLTTAEVSQVLNVSQRTIARYVKSKQLTPVFVKNKNLFDPESIAHFSADAEKIEDKLKKQTEYNSNRIAELELRVRLLEQLLDLGRHDLITEEEVDVKEVRRAFRDKLTTKTWGITEVEIVLGDLNRLSNSLVRKVGTELVMDLLTACEIQARLAKHDRTQIAVGRARLLKRAFNDS